MRKIGSSIVGLALAALFLSGPAAGATPDKYQVTGEVTEVSDTMIVVMKGKERFEIARDAGTKVEGALAKGSKVTIKYKMTATSVEVKAAKAPAKSTAKKKAA